MDVKLTTPPSEHEAYRIDLTLSPEELAEQYDSNFRHGGMFVMIADAIRQYAKIEVNLINAASNAKIELSGELVHAAEAPPGTPRGVSIQFTNLGEALKERLEQFARDAGEAPAPPEDADDEGELFDIDGIPDDEDSRVIEEMIHSMGNARRVEMALTGKKRQRMIMLRMLGVDIVPDLLKNPDLTVFELKEILKLPKLPHTIIEEIAANDEWSKTDEVRLGLFLNSKTPVSIARKYLPYIRTKDLIHIQKTKQVKGALKQMVDRLLATRLKTEPTPKWNK